MAKSKTKTKRPKIATGQTRQGVKHDKRSYDAAATNRHNANHWLYATGGDADSVIGPGLATLRNRTRYEIRNNAYAVGIAETYANDLVGAGPTLQISTEDTEFDREIEDKFEQWCLECDVSGVLSFDDMLRLAGGLQQCESGEGLIVMQNARGRQRAWPSVQKKQVELRLQIVEPDRLATPCEMIGSVYDDKIKDGIEVDEFGQRLFYYILRSHPGSNLYSGFGEYDKVPADSVIHIYRQNRPGQTRGVPRFAPALGLFAQLRRFTSATLSAAEQAANVSGIIKTDASAAEADSTHEGEELEVPQNTLLGLAPGSEIEQLKSEHPSTTYQMFKHEIINEIARCINMPFNIAAANSSSYNYASGRLDWQVYYKAIKTDRRWLERMFLNRIFWAWLREAMLIPGYIKYKGKLLVPHAFQPEWFWPGAEHVDPVKEAVAQGHRLKNLTTTLSAEFASQGKDWEREVRQRAKENKLLDELGLEFKQNKTNGNNEDTSDEDEEQKNKSNAA